VRYELAEIYRTAAAESTGESAALVVHCSDPRYQPHFQEFLAKGLGLRLYGLLAVPGGAQLLTMTDYLPKYSWTGWRWTKFMMNLSQPDRVVLIAHEDCRWYLDPRFGHGLTRIEARQIEDLEQVRRSMIERFGARRIDIYYARLESGRAAFQAL
jgi:hypothetical protein